MYPLEQEPAEEPLADAGREQLLRVVEEQPGAGFTVTVNSLLVLVSPVEGLFART